MRTEQISPRLVVDDAASALDFYTGAMAGTELVRYAEPSGKIVHAEVQIGAGVFSLTEADGEMDLGTVGEHGTGGLSVSPLMLGGSAVLLTLVVDDADSVGAAMEAAGAEVVIPIDDRYYGRREGRLRDPFGHLWIISQNGEDLDDDEIRGRVDEAAG